MTQQRHQEDKVWRRNYDQRNFVFAHLLYLPSNIVFPTRPAQPQVDGQIVYIVAQKLVQLLLNPLLGTGESRQQCPYTEKN